MKIPETKVYAALGPFFHWIGSGHPLVSGYLCLLEGSNQPSSPHVSVCAFILGLVSLTRKCMNSLTNNYLIAHFDLTSVRLHLTNNIEFKEGIEDV